MAQYDLTYEDFVAGQNAKNARDAGYARDMAKTWDINPANANKTPRFTSTMEDFLQARKALGLDVGGSPSQAQAQNPISVPSGIIDSTNTDFKDLITTLKASINAPVAKTNYQDLLPKAGAGDATFQSLVDSVTSQLENIGKDRTDFSGDITRIQGDTTFADTLANLNSQLSGFTTGKAFSDAAGLMNQRAQIEREKNAPVIQKAMEGAGTSAGSMQALLAQRDASNTATAASALGAEQSKTYAAATSNILTALSTLAANGDPQAKALTDILKLKSQERNQDVASASTLTSTLGQLVANGDPNNKLLVELAGLQQKENDSQLQTKTQLTQYLAQMATQGDPQAKALLDIYKTQVQSSDIREQIAASERNTTRSVEGGVKQSGIAADTSLTNAATQAASARYQTDAQVAVENAKLISARINNQLLQASKLSADEEDNPWE